MTSKKNLLLGMILSVIVMLSACTSNSTSSTKLSANEVNSLKKVTELKK